MEVEVCTSIVLLVDSVAVMTVVDVMDSVVGVTSIDLVTAVVAVVVVVKVSSTPLIVTVTSLTNGSSPTVVVVVDVDIAVVVADTVTVAVDIADTVMVDVDGDGDVVVEFGFDAGGVGFLWFGGFGGGLAFTTTTLSLPLCVTVLLSTLLLVDICCCCVVVDDDNGVVDVGDVVSVADDNTVPLLGGRGVNLDGGGLGGCFTTELLLLSGDEVLIIPVFAEGSGDCVEFTASDVPSFDSTGTLPSLGRTGCVGRDVVKCPR